MISAVLLLCIPSQQRRIVTFIAFPALVMLCTWWEGRITDKAEQFIALLGKMSFEVYIWHYPLMALEQMVLRVSGYEVYRSYLSMLTFTLMVWLIAYPIYRYVEVPINRTIRKYLS